MSLLRIFGAMHGHDKPKGSSIYGVRLGNMLVVDADTDNDATADYIAKHFPTASVQVKTPRGRHHYFKLDANTEIPKPVDREGVRIDFKRGVNSFVVGPESVRIDGGKYVPAIGDLGLTDLVPFSVNSRGLDSSNIYNYTPSPVSSGPNRLQCETKIKSPETPYSNRNNEIFGFACDFAVFMVVVLPCLSV